MSYDTTYNMNASVGGKSFTSQETLEATGLEAVEDTIPVAQAGTLSTRTDNNTGVLTLSTGHGITDGQKVDLYWSGGQRRYMTVGSVVTNSVPIDLGSGDNLPIATTAIIVAVVQEYTVSIDGDSAVAIFAGGADVARWQIILLSTGGTAEELVLHGDAGEAYSWLSTSLETNPIAGDSIDEIHISIADTASTRKARVSVPIDI